VPGWSFTRDWDDEREEARATSEGDTGLSIILRGCPGAYQGGQFAVPDLLSTAMGLFQV
jgi:hypothetical protein